MAVLGWQAGKFTGRNILEVQPKLQIFTWVFNVMPVFFLVGGFANAASWTSASQRGLSFADWLRRRSSRLLRPAIMFVAFWTVLPAIAVMGGLPASVARTGGREVALPLWFLAIYVVTIAAAPPLLAAHRRYGPGVIVTLVAGAAVVDLTNFGAGIPVVGELNYAFVWLAVLELGFLWRDGTLTSRRWLPWVMAFGGLAVMTALVRLVDYPVSMLDLSHATRSNAFPPSFALLALAVWQTGAVLILEGAGNRALQHMKLWLLVVQANSMIMTMYLWNMSAVVLAAVILLPTGIFPQPVPLSASWLALRVVWILACAVCLIPFVLGFRWAERPTEPPPASGPGLLSTIVAVAGVAASAAGLGILADVAFPVPGQGPLVPGIGVALFALGALLLEVNPFAKGVTLNASN